MAEVIDDRPLECPSGECDCLYAENIAAALALHEPERVCQAHHNAHDCGGPWLYRCYVCAKTRTTPCRTWQILTGREKP